MPKKIMKMKFADIKKVSNGQIAFCHTLSVDVSGDTVGVAAAKIEEKIQISFWSNQQRDSPTEKQIALANKFGINIKSMSRIVGDAVINDIMSQLNINAIKEQKLEAGVCVKNKHESTGNTYVISSIGLDGTVYFKGGNGKRAWARSLINAEMA